MTPTSAERPDAGSPRRPTAVRRVVVVGSALSLAGAVVVGLLGVDGAGSLAAALVGAACTVGVAGLTALVGALRDEARGRRATRGRIALGIALLLSAPVLLVLAAGAAGAR